MNYEQIGKFIQKKRKEKNLTQKQLATKLNITDKAISKWERGLGCPDISILEPLARELETSILEILKGKTIEKEIINTTDNYIKETINYTKSNIKNTINKIISFLMLLLSYKLTDINLFVVFFMHAKN